MPSASSLVKDALESYIAGGVKAERLVIAVSAAYYREAPNAAALDRCDRPCISRNRRARHGSGRLGLRNQSRRATLPQGTRSGVAAGGGGRAVGRRDGRRSNRTVFGYDRAPRGRRAPRVQPVSLTTTPATAPAAASAACHPRQQDRAAGRPHRDSDRLDASRDISSPPARTAWTAEAASFAARAEPPPRASAPARTSQWRRRGP